MIKLMVAVAAPLVGVALSQAADASPPISRPRPLLIAHRGASRAAPENTLPAFRMALADRADLVELDYLHSSDGVPLVIHDDTLDRTTDAVRRWGGKDIPVSSRTAAEIAELEAGQWFGPAFIGTRIPTLLEAVSAIQAGGFSLIEHKGGDATTLVRLLKQQGWIESVVVQSFDWGFLRDARRLAPGLALGALGPPSRRDGRKLSDEEKVLSASYLDEIKSIGPQVIVWNSQLTAEAVDLAHTRGFRVWVYTINEPDEARRLLALGIDGLITDRPADLRAHLQPQADEGANSNSLASRNIPAALPDHPGQVFLEGEVVSVTVPIDAGDGPLPWRVLDDRREVLNAGSLPRHHGAGIRRLELEGLGIGWYRIEFGEARQSAVPFTTAAVLAPLRAPTPFDSPVCVDSATAWFAREDVEHQRRLASFAALAGVNWVRDRLRWADLQPVDGPLRPPPTTYDTAAEIQRQAGLKVLQVFHDTPRWAREEPETGGRFAPDLRQVYRFARGLALRFEGSVQAWEPWNEANVASFGGHTVDQMCSWQKAAYLGFKAGDPEVIVGWNATAAVPTPQHTAGVLANETWPYYDTYNIHTYDWSHAYRALWQPAREAVAGRPLWVTEADRGTPHLRQPPFFDQDPHLEQLKAHWIAQSYAGSLFAGARRHFHFILGHYHEPQGVQFGLLRLDLTPRPAYVALAAVGRCLAGARILGRWSPRPDIHLYAFRAQPDGVERDVLVLWAEKEADWPDRGKTQVSWQLPSQLTIQGVVDHLGRPLGRTPPTALGSAPLFVFLPAGQGVTLPLEPPPPLAPRRTGDASPVVLQLLVTAAARMRVEDLPWSEGYVLQASPDQVLDWTLCLYNFADEPVDGQLRVANAPSGWDVSPGIDNFRLDPLERRTVAGRLRIAPGPGVADGWVTLRADCGPHGRPVLSFRALGNPGTPAGTGAP